MLLLKIAMLFGKTWRVVLGLLILSPFLIILVVTMGLADINTSAPNSEQLAAKQSALTGTISLAGRPHDQPIPATLVGTLSTFFATPVIEGWENTLRAEFTKWSGSTPGSLSGWYLFAFPTPPHPSATSAGWLSYRGARYRVPLTCQGQIAQLLCFATVRLPGSAAPSGFNWGTESLTSGTPGGIAPQKALVYQGTKSRETVGLADIEIYGQNSDGTDTLQITDQDGQPIRPGSPVVLDDRSRVLPLFGLAVPEKNGGPSDVVYPLDLLGLYGEGIADRLAGTPPQGAEAYAGVLFSASPGPVVIDTVADGGPADDAGIQPDDEILAIDGQAVTSPADVTRILSACRPGQTVPVEILRADRTITLKVTLGYRPV